MKEKIKPKEVVEAEGLLKPERVWFDECRTCGNGWFVDYNYPNNRTATAYRFKFIGKKVKIIYLGFRFTTIQHMDFKDWKECKLFLKVYFKKIFN